MAALKQRSEGIFSADMKPGTPVYDNAKGEGAPLPQVAFTVNGKDYETDENGLLIDLLVAAAEAVVEYLNPLTPGVTYPDVIKQLPDTKPETIKDHLINKVIDFFEDHVVDWLVDEITNFLKGNKNKN